jgi:hypothetical protein
MWLQDTIEWCGLRSQVQDDAVSDSGGADQMEVDGVKTEEDVVWLSDDKDMQDSCIMLVDFIHKFGGKWVEQLRVGVSGAGSRGAGLKEHMEWITPQLLAEAVHTRKPCRMVVDLHMWLLQVFSLSELLYVLCYLTYKYLQPTHPCRCWWTWTSRRTRCC